MRTRNLHSPLPPALARVNKRQVLVAISTRVGRSSVELRRTAREPCFSPQYHLGTSYTRLLYLSSEFPAHSVSQCTQGILVTFRVRSSVRVSSVNVSITEHACKPSILLSFSSQFPVTRPEVVMPRKQSYTLHRWRYDLPSPSTR